MSDLLYQQRFSLLVARLILHAAHLGYGVTLGDCFRDPRSSYGATHSLHKRRLAIDINLFSPSGEYLTTVSDHRKLGEWWETLDPNCVWGGRWKNGDANHYELRPENIA